MKQQRRYSPIRRGLQIPQIPKKVDVAVVVEKVFIFDSFARYGFRVFASIGSWDNEVKIIPRKKLGWQAVPSSRYLRRWRS